MIDSIINEDRESASDLLRLHVQNLISKNINEDHELYMSSSQMEKHLNKLHGLATDKSAFLKTLANYSDKTECTESDFKACSHSIVGKGKEHADKAIHKLESQVGYTFDPKDLKENFSNVITRALAGVPDGGAKIPNVYTTKNASKLKKGLPKLKKSKYGTGNTPASLGVGSGGESAGGDGGGGE